MRTPPVLSVTLGEGLHRPRGMRGLADGLEQLAQILAGHAGPEAWWSPGLFRGNRRRAELWEGAGLIGVDLDHHDAAGAHASVPASTVGPALAAAPPGNLAHATPRGLRLVFLLTEVATDPEAWTRAAQGACELARGWLTDAGLAAEAGQAGLRVDVAASCDRARLFFAPRATVGREARTADVEVLRPDPYDVAELAAAAPVASEEGGVSQVSQVSHVADDPVAELERAERYARGALARAVAKVQAAPEGQRNETLNAEAFSLAGLPGIDGEQALQALIGAAIRGGLPQAEATRTALSGWKAGEKRPRNPTPPGQAPSQVSQVSHVARTCEPTWIPLPIQALPAPLRDLATHGARASGVDPAAIGVLGLGVLTGAIGNAVRLRVKAGWLAVAVLWTVLVARSGFRKSPVLRLLLEPLHDLERRAARAYRARMRKWAEELAAWKRQKPAARGEEPERPAPRERFVVGDTTVEKLGLTLDENPRGVLVERDELRAWFGSFDAYKASGRGGDEAQWLSMYDAGPLVIDRISRESLYVPHAAVSIAGAVQPRVLRACLTTERHASGMVARLLLAAPPEVPGGWNDATVPREVTEAWGRTLKALRALPVPTDADGDLVPRQLELDPAAREQYGAFVTRTREAVIEADDDVAARLSKAEGVAARLALVITLAEDPAAEVVGADAMRRAIVLAEWFTHEAERVRHLLARPEVEQQRRQLLAWLRRRGGRASVRETQNGGPAHLRKGAGRAQAALEELAVAGLGTWQDPPGSAGRVFVLCDSATCDSAPQAPAGKPGFLGSAAREAGAGLSQAPATVAGVAALDGSTDRPAPPIAEGDWGFA